MSKESHTGGSTSAHHRGSTAAAIAHHQFNNPTHHIRTTHQLTRSAKNKKLFPQKLWDLINDDRYNFCLRWSDDGQLVYLNRDQFEDCYLKTPENQFHTQKAISFVRQMNMYGFRKVDDCYYENDNFKRNCNYLLKNMIRKHPNKGGLPQPAQKLACHSQALSNGQSPEASNTTSNQSSPVMIDTSLVQRQHNNQQKELLLLHQHQHQHQNNTQLPTDLTMTQESRHLNHPHQQNNSENNNLNVLYTLLASLNSNLYQPLLLNQQPANQTSDDRPLDLNRFTELQHLYQHIFEQILFKASS